MMPIGRHHASGLSLLLLATRFFRSSWPSGVSGSPPLMFWPTSRKPAGGGASGSAGGAAPRPGNAFSPCQSPEKSGLPSAVRGVGAFRLTSPVAVRGTVGSGWFGHCANSDDDSATTTVAVIVSRALGIFIGISLNSEPALSRFARYGRAARVLGGTRQSWGGIMRWELKG